MKDKQRTLLFLAGLGLGIWWRRTAHMRVGSFPGARAVKKIATVKIHETTDDFQEGGIREVARENFDDWKKMLTLRGKRELAREAVEAHRKFRDEDMEIHPIAEALL